MKNYFINTDTLKIENKYDYDLVEIDFDYEEFLDCKLNERENYLKENFDFMEFLGWYNMELPETVLFIVNLTGKENEMVSATEQDLDMVCKAIFNNLNVKLTQEEEKEKTRAYDYSFLPTRLEAVMNTGLFASLKYLQSTCLIKNIQIKVGDLYFIEKGQK